MTIESVEDFLKRGGEIKKVGFESAYSSCKVHMRQYIDWERKKRLEKAQIKAGKRKDEYLGIKKA